jgi:hypothetical protein
MDSFIVVLWGFIFKVLRCFNIFYIFQLILNKLTNDDACMRLPTHSRNATGSSVNRHDDQFNKGVRAFVADAWCLAWFGLSLGFLLAAPSVSPYVNTAFMMLGAYRVVVDMVVYQINCVLFDPLTVPRGCHHLHSACRSVVLAIQGYFEIMLWFALFYLNMAGHFTLRADAGLQCQQSQACAVYFSLVTMATLGPNGDFVPRDKFSLCLVTCHLAIAVFWAIIVLARFLAILPNPEVFHEGDDNSLARALVCIKRICPKAGYVLLGDL